MTPDDLLAELSPLLDRALIATDFDGTLAPLMPDPDDSRLVPGGLDALADLAGRGAQVAVITGRAAETVVRLGGLDAVPRLVVAGIYGIETWRDGAVSAPETPAAIEALRGRLPAVLADADADPAIWIEDKRLSLVVHARKTDDPDAALAVVRPSVDALAAELDLEVHPGADVLELRVPGHDKGAVLRGLVAEHRPDAVLFLGDDVGDVPALHEIRRLRAEGLSAWGVAVTSSGVGAVADAADVRLADADEAVWLLRALSR